MTLPQATERVLILGPTTSPPRGVLQLCYEYATLMLHLLSDGVTAVNQ
jgi:hypothetical protein